MKRGIAQAGLLVLAVAVGALLLFGTGFKLPGTASIVAISNVQFDEATSQITAAMTVDSPETLSFLNPTNFSLADGRTLATTQRVEVRTSQLPPYCKVSLGAGKDHYWWDLVNAFDVDYYRPNAPSYARVAPYKFGVQKWYGDSGLLAETIADQTVDVSLQQTLTFSSATGGTLALRNLGSLVGAIDCPPAADVVLLRDKSGGFVLKSWTSYQNFRGLQTQALFGSFSAMFTALSTQVYAPTGYPTNTAACDPTYTSCAVNTAYISTAATPELRYSISYGSFVPLITLSMSSDFAKAVYYTPSNGQPFVTLTKVPEAFQTNTAKFEASVQNIGVGDDSFSIMPGSLYGRYSFTPASLGNEPITKSASRLFAFDAYAANVGSDRLCVTAVAKGSGKSHTGCADTRVLIPAGATPFPTPTAGVVNPTPAPGPISPTPAPGREYVCPDNKVVDDPKKCVTQTDWVFYGALAAVAAGAYILMRRRK